MDRRIVSLFFTVLLVLTWPVASSAEFRMRWTEVDLVLDRDGKAEVTYQVRWTCRGANLHGFYFEGFQESPVFDYAGSYAVDQTGRRYGLSIKRLSNKKYDVVLENGQAFHDGEITYVLRYAADLQASGNVTLTDSKSSGRLAVFNWSPVQWADYLEHEAVKVYYPVPIEPLNSMTRELERVKFMTEKFVNERYRIDYSPVKGKDNSDLLRVLYYREKLPSRY